MSQTPSVPPPIRKLRRVGTELLVRIACYTSLASMLLMVWSVLDPTPFPVMVSMSVGQAIGTIALLAYLAAVLVSQWRGDHKSIPPRAHSPESPSRPAAE